MNTHRCIVVVHFFLKIYICARSHTHLWFVMNWFLSSIYFYFYCVCISFGSFGGIASQVSDMLAVTLIRNERERERGGNSSTLLKCACINFLLLVILVVVVVVWHWKRKRKWIAILQLISWCINLFGMWNPCESSKRERSMSPIVDV